MITTFQTPASVTAPAATGNGGKTLLTIAIIGVLAYLGYRYIIKPSLDKKKEQTEG